MLKGESFNTQIKDYVCKKGHKRPRSRTLKIGESLIAKIKNYEYKMVMQHQYQRF